MNAKRYASANIFLMLVAHSLLPTNVLGQVACQMGINGSLWSAQTIAPSPVSYYTLLDPNSCTECGPGGMTLSAVHVGIISAGCTLEATVSVVGATFSAPGCYQPDPANVVCASVLRTFSTGGIQDVEMTPPVGCCITEPAFLCITLAFPGGVDCASLVGVQNCTACATWVSNFGEWCTRFGSLIGGPIMYVESDCCQTVPTLPENWGRLKALYR